MFLQIGSARVQAACKPGEIRVKVGILSSSLHEYTRLALLQRVAYMLHTPFCMMRA